MDSENEITGRERFTRLEDRIYRVNEVFRGLTARNHELQEENQRLKNYCSEVETRYLRLKSTLESFFQDRGAVEEKVQQMLDALDSIENRI